MLDKEDKFPGLYETYANLGTSYIHNAQLEEGLQYIKKAIEINPEAHFGREVYQQYLVEYVLSKQDSSGNVSLPLSEGTEPDFYSFLKERHFQDAYAAGSNKDAELAKAVKGVAGMMKFGNYESPVLLEVLGDLLYAANSGTDPGAGHLAARAYLKVAIDMPEGEIADKYRAKATQSLELLYLDEGIRNRLGPHRSRDMYEGPVIGIRSMEKTLKLEVQSADAWFEEIATKEKAWIAQGVNPDSAFSAEFYEEPIQDSHFNEYGRMVTGELDEQYWLSRQLDSIQHIRDIKMPGLSDEQKAELRVLYDSEFRDMEKLDSLRQDSLAQVEASKPKAEKDEEEPSEDSGTHLLYILLIAGGAVALVTVLFILRKKNTKP